MRHRLSSLRQSVLRYWKLSMSFLVLMLVCMLAAFTTYTGAERLAWDTRAHANLLLLENAMQVLDDSLRQLKELASAVSNMSDVQAFVSRRYTDRGALTSDMMTLTANLPNLSVGSRLLLGYYIYSFDNDTVISPQRGFTQPHRYYQDEFRYNDCDYAAWRSQILMRPSSGLFLPAAEVRYKQQSHQAMAYLLSVFRSGGQSLQISAQMVFLIDVTRIHGILRAVMENGAAGVCIFDSEGRMMTALGLDGVPVEGPDIRALGTSGLERQSWQGQRSILSFCTSDALGWTYCAWTPESVIQAQVRGILGPVILNLVVVVFLGLVTTTALIRYNRKPLLDLSKRLPEAESKAHFNLRDLVQSVSRLITGKEALEARLAQQRDLLRMALLNRIASGEILDEPALRHHMKEVNLTLPEAAVCRGVILRLQWPEDAPGNAVHQARVQDLLRRYEAFLPLVAPADALHFTMLYVEAEETASFFQSLQREIEQSIGAQAVFFAGTAVETLTETGASFAHARRLLDAHPEAVEPFLLLADEEEQFTAQCAYGPQQEQRLMNLLAIGDLGAIEAQIDGLYASNFIDRGLTPFARTLLYYRMLGTLVLADPGIRLPCELTDHVHSLPAARFFTLLKAQYARQCAQTALNRSQHQERLIQQIIQYLQSNYSRNELSLQLVASRFHLSESKLSQLIKRSLGETFSAYVERLRIVQANRLLEQHALAIEQIAQAVGYTSVHSFRRAFKRVVGLNPSAYVRQRLG